MPRPAGFAVMALLGVAALSLGCTQSEPRADEKRDGGDAVHDASITTLIKTTYLFNQHLDSCRIQVDTRGGVVTLQGSVPSDIHRDLAVAIAGNAEGVRQVRNELALAEMEGDGPEEAERTYGEAVRDASVTASVKMALAFERSVRGSAIRVRTERGTVTLTGEVDSEAERQIAARVARDIEGVKHVVSNVHVRS